MKSLPMFPIRLIIGLVALMLTVPFILIALMFALTGNKDWANRIADNSPLYQWFDYIEN